MYMSDYVEHLDNVLKTMGEKLLQGAGLPGDVFSHKTPAMKEEEYFKFMEAVGSLVTEPETPIHIA